MTAPSPTGLVINEYYDFTPTTQFGNVFELDKSVVCINGSAVDLPALARRGFPELLIASMDSMRH